MKQLLFNFYKMNNRFDVQSLVPSPRLAVARATRDQEPMTVRLADDLADRGSTIAVAGNNDVHTV